MVGRGDGALSDRELLVVFCLLPASATEADASALAKNAPASALTDVVPEMEAVTWLVADMVTVRLKVVPRAMRRRTLCVTTKCESVSLTSRFTLPFSISPLVQWLSVLAEAEAEAEREGEVAASAVDTGTTRATVVAAASAAA